MDNILWEEKKQPEKYTKLFLVKERKICMNTSKAREKKKSQKQQGKQKLITRWEKKSW